MHLTERCRRTAGGQAGQPRRERCLRPGFIVATHLPAEVLGIAALFVGMYVQLISATREERVIIMAGVVAAFVGAGLGFAHGGFSV